VLLGSAEAVLSVLKLFTGTMPKFTPVYTIPVFVKVRVPAARL